MEEVKKESIIQEKFSYGLEDNKEEFKTADFIKGVESGKYVIMTNEEYTKNNQTLNYVYETIKKADSNKPGYWEATVKVADNETIEEDNENNKENIIEGENIMSEEKKNETVESDLLKLVKDLTDKVNVLTQNTQDKDLIAFRDKVKSKCAVDNVDEEYAIYLLSTGKAKNLDEAIKITKEKFKADESAAETDEEKTAREAKEKKEAEEKNGKEGTEKTEEEKAKEVQDLLSGEEVPVETKPANEEEKIKVDYKDDNSIRNSAVKILDNLRSKNK